MHLNFIKNTVLLFVLTLLSCRNQTNSQAQSPLRVGAQQTETYLPILKNKTVGILANQTSVIFKEDGYTHLVDSLLSLNVAVKKVFAPEHGFRGIADAGEYVKDGVDSGSGVPIVSLYGANKKPDAKTLNGLDVVIFDVQDVGARFYTFLSTLHYIMETCAELGITVLVLDRPNPNGHYVDGPILDLNNSSFVGMHPVPHDAGRAPRALQQGARPPPTPGRARPGADAARLRGAGPHWLPRPHGAARPRAQQYPPVRRHRSRAGGAARGLPRALRAGCADHARRCKRRGCPRRQRLRGYD